MHEIVVLSGKGGAGKTSVTAALARAMSAREKIVVCDYDVDAPDLHILLKPETEMRADFVSGHLAVFNSDNCIDCTQCLAFCRFDAIKQAAPCEYPVIEQLCEGCAVCVKLCPELAFDFVPRHCGEYYRSRTRFGTMIHAELTPGAENSGRLILLLKQEAAKAAQADGAEIILSDGTPGIGCPVISSLSGAGLVCAVIEAGASGIADFKRLAELARRFRLPIAVIVNKADRPLLVLWDEPYTGDALRAAGIGVIMADARINQSACTDEGHETFHKKVEGLGFLPNVPLTRTAEDARALADSLVKVSAL